MVLLSSGLRNKLQVKDKFKNKKGDRKFLDARNLRCLQAFRLLGGGPFVYLDSPKLGTTRFLQEGGVDLTQAFPVNARDEGNFSAAATKMGARPLVCNLAKADQLLLELHGVGRPPMVYNDGTHGNPRRTLHDMKPLLNIMPHRAYLSVTFVCRSRNGIPATGKLKLIHLLATKGFCPPGGWKRLGSALTFDGRVYNLHMIRGISDEACERSGLCDENSFSVSKRASNGARPPSRHHPKSLQTKLKGLLKKCPAKPYPMNSATPHASEWESLRLAIFNKGRRAEQAILQALAPRTWPVKAYAAWRSQRRLPKDQRKAEELHWKEAGLWLAAGLDKLFGAASTFPPRNGSILVMLEGHSRPDNYRTWLDSILSRDLLSKTLCTGDVQVNSAVKSNVTRGRCNPARLSESLAEALLKPSGRAVLSRYADLFSVILLPLLTVGSFEEVEDMLRAATDVAAARSFLLVTIKVPHSSQMVDWTTKTIAKLNQYHNYKLATFCPVCQEGSGLEDHSGLWTIAVFRDKE